ncbi:MAG: Fic family protein [Actinobacteria bacterium]|nr:Fic family protein [Actinomycetota bacterium]
MSQLLALHWPPGASGLTRRDRQGCAYQAYVPDPLAGRRFVLDGDVAADVADAEAAIVRLNAEGAALVQTEALARILLRAEAVASSKIEGLEVGPARLLKEEAAREFGAGRRADVTAAEVLGSIAAMEDALARAGAEDRITVDALLGIHLRLLEGTRLDAHAGRLRDVQNWIGGSDYNPCSAAFVPPPAAYVPDLMADLAAFCNDDTLPAVVQAAIAHAQFETIHPFADGNGRAGRALIHLVLRRRGLAPRVVPPVSLVLATLATSYVDGLAAFRHLGTVDSADAAAGLNRWLAFFAGCCVRAVRDSEAYEERIRAIQDGWRTRVRPVRKNSAADVLIEMLPASPVLTVTAAARLIGRSFNAAGGAVGRLAEAGILRQSSIGRRNRVYEAPDVIDAFVTLERQLASPDGDTLASPLARPAPARR